ncbi:creatininase family protein [Shinella sp.]|uniref:creatininase family protein n=1 Tax=Shinella sp. TaxID=1870904 RepID=UPI003F6F74E0
MTKSIELLRPAQIRTALAECSLIYLPLGTIEWHCEHLPVGLDALTAHGLCLRAAEVSGGLVWPALYYGTGGGHGAYPWTVMMDGPEHLEALLRKTFDRLADMKVERVVLLSGHFADAQLEMIDRLQAEAVASRPLTVRATAVNRFDIPGYPPDHAGRFETTLLAGLWPETVELDALPVRTDGDDTPDRHDPSHPLWGVIGADPRAAALPAGPALVGEFAAKLAVFATA